METTILNHKLRPQPALAHLTDAEREQIADWLRTQNYAQVLERVAKQRSEGGFDLHISIRVLQTLRERTAHQQLINEQLEDKLQLAELLALENGEPVQWSQGTHQLVQRAAFKLALLPGLTAEQLQALTRIADHPRRIAMDEFRKHIATEKVALDKSRLQLAERSTKGRHPQSSPLPLAKEGAMASGDSDTSDRPCDHLGPLARNWEDVGERVRKAFGISPEESARRAELRKTWKQPPIDPPPLEQSGPAASIPARPLNVVNLLKDLAADAEVTSKSSGHARSGQSPYENGSSAPSSPLLSLQLGS